MTDIRPTDDHLVVTMIPHKENGGLIAIPEVAQGRRNEFGQSESGSLRGRVLAIGPGKLGKRGKRRPLDVAVGDVVWFSGITDWEQDSVMLIREGDIMLVEESAHA